MRTFVLFSFLCAFAYGSEQQMVHLKVESVCNDTPILQVSETYSESHHINAGQWTFEQLTQHEVNFEGGEEWIGAINDSPTGDAAFQVVNENLTRAYGWCYSVNGNVPPVTPNEYPLSAGDSIDWFYGFAEKRDGEWSTTCYRTNEDIRSFLCD